MYREGLIKLSQSVLRFALVLRIAKFAADEGTDAAVELEDIEAGILLFDFFAAELDYIYGIVVNEDITLSMTEKQRTFYNSLRPDNIMVGAPLYELASEKYGLTRDMVKKFLANKKYFTRTEKGIYKRNYVADPYLNID